MKAFLLPTLFLLLSVSLFGQDPVQEVTISSIDCDDVEKTVSFNLTWTEDNVVVEAESSVTIRTTTDDNSIFMMGIADGGDNFNNFRVESADFSGSSFSTCADLIGSTVKIFDNGDGRNTNFVFGEAVVAGAIPTMGQWALLIFGLLMASLGVVAISNKKEVIA